jgi:hypothetical protein
MSKNEIQVLRANLLGGMDAYVREHLDDENYLMGWLELGVPDGADEEELMEIAGDEEEFNRITDIFSNIISNFAEEYGTGD